MGDLIKIIQIYNYVCNLLVIMIEEMVKVLILKLHQQKKKLLQQKLQLLKNHQERRNKENQRNQLLPNQQHQVVLVVNVPISSKNVKLVKAQNVKKVEVIETVKREVVRQKFRIKIF